MTVKHNHKYVSSDGHAYFPYLNEWSKLPAKSNLVGLIEVACNLFSIEPPLFSKPPPSLVNHTIAGTNDYYHYADVDDSDDYNHADGDINYIIIEPILFLFIYSTSC